MVGQTKEKWRINILAGSQNGGHQKWQHPQQGNLVHQDRVPRPLDPRKSLMTQGSEKKEDLEETEGMEDSYYIPNDYYSVESGYDSDMFKKYWKDDF